MPEIFRAVGCVFSIFPDDHDPPHVHVIGPGWRMKVALSDPPDLVLVEGKVTKQEARKTLRLTREHLSQLIESWESIHG
jgi:hypothetical protein